MRFKFLSTGLFVCLFMLVSASSDAAENPWDTDKYGTVTGQVRYYYFTQRDKLKTASDDTIQESLAIGGFLKYESPWVADTFRAGLAGYTSQPFPSSFNQADEAGTQLLTSMNTGITTLGELYLAGRFAESEATIYRQRIETPMVNGNDSRMIPQTFEAISLTSKDVENLKIQVAYIDKIKLRDTDEFKSMSKVSNNSKMLGSRRGMAMVGGDWSPEFMKMRGWYYHIPDYMQMLFLQAGSTHSVREDFSIHWLAQGLDQRSTGNSDGGGFNVGELGLLGGATVSGVKMELGGTIVDNSADVVSRWGTYPFFNNMMSFANNRAGEKALYMAVAYDFTRIGWNGFTSSIKTSFADTPDSGSNASADRNEYNLNLNYAFSGDLEGLSILNRWSYQDTKGVKDGKQVRLRIQYDF